MPTNRVPSFVPSLIELIEASRRSILVAPFNLGGASGSGGGTGSPPGGTVGQLIQRSVAYDTSELATLSGSSSLVDNLNHLRARAATARALFNRSGVTLIAGTVVVIHTGADNSFETTTTASDVDVLGVLQQNTASGSSGIVIFNGYSPAVRVSGTVNRGDYLYHAASAGLAQAASSGSLIGCFGRALTSSSGSLIAAVIWHPGQSSGTGGGGGSGDVSTDLIWDAKADLAVGTGANTAQRLASGSTGQVLTVNPATTTGLEWATPSAGGTLSGGGAATNVALWSGATTLDDDPLFNYDPANTRVVLGRSSAMAGFSARLQIYRDGQQTGVTVISSGSTPFMGFAYMGGSFASPVAVNSGEILFDISGNAWAATTDNFVSPPPMRLVGYAAEAWDSAVGYGNYWEFVTTPVGSTTRVGAVRMHAFGIGLRESTPPSTPPTNWGSLYAKTDGILYWKNDAGAEYDLTASGSGGAASLLSNTAWNAKGDLLAGTADDTATILASGSNGQVLTVDTTQTTGLIWATPSASGGGMDILQMQVFT